ncbi:MAG: tape measure protein [Candidatus Limiplasma sp.]|nr:tape measure protein [Candidatus Limiplasma sp.]
MASDGSVVFSTELDESGLKNALQGLGGKIATWTKAAGVALSGVGAGLGALAKKAFGYNRQMEDYQTNFSVLLGDEAKALEHVAYLRERAAKTPFGMEDLAGASQTMLSFGLSTEKSYQAMEQLGDIALGNKAQFQSLTLAFSQISAAGKLSGQDLLQMVNAGFNPLNTIAEKTGTNLGDLKEVMAGSKGSDAFQKQMKAAQEEVEKLGDQASEGAKLLAQIGKDGYISAEMVGKAMEIETAPGGRFYNGMQKASQTMSGLISTLKDDADALVGEVFAPMTEQIGKTVIPMAQGYLQQLTQAFHSGGTIGLISALGAALGDAVGKISGKLPVIVSLAAKIITALTNALTKNAKTITKGIASALTAAVKGLTPAIPELLAGAIIILSELFTSLSGELPQLIEGLTEALIGGIMTLIENAPALLDAGVAIIQAIGTGIANALPMIFDNIPGILQSALGVISDVWSNRIWPVIQGLFKAVFGIELPAWNEIVSKIKTWWERSVWPGIQSFFLAAFGIELPDWNTIVDSISTWWGKVWEAVKNYWTVVFSVFTEDEDGQGAITRITDWWDKVKTAISELFKAVFGIDFSGTLESIKTWWEETKTKVSEFFKAPFGIDFSGTLESIKTWWEETKTKVAEFFKVTLGIETPSKEDEEWNDWHNQVESGNWYPFATDAAQQDAKGAQQAYQDSAADINTSRQDALTPEEGTIAPTPMTEGAESDVTGAINAIDNGAEGIANSAGSAVENGVNAANAETARGYAVGANLAGEVASGVRNSGWMVTDALAGIVQGAAASIRRTARFASAGRPSSGAATASLSADAPQAASLNAEAPQGSVMSTFALRRGVDSMLASFTPRAKETDLGVDGGTALSAGQRYASQMAPMPRLDLSGIGSTVAAAVREGMSGIGVNMNGERVGDIVTERVSRNIQDVAWTERYA